MVSPQGEEVPGGSARGGHATNLPQRGYSTNYPRWGPLSTGPTAFPTARRRSPPLQPSLPQTQVQGPQQARQRVRRHPSGPRAVSVVQPRPPPTVAETYENGPRLPLVPIVPPVERHKLRQGRVRIHEPTYDDPLTRRRRRLNPWPLQVRSHLSSFLPVGRLAPRVASRNPAAAQTFVALAAPPLTSTHDHVSMLSSPPPRAEVLYLSGEPLWPL